MMKIIMAEEFNNQLYVRADVVQSHIKEAVNNEREACAQLMSTLTCMGDAKECFEVAATYISARGQHD